MDEKLFVALINCVAELRAKGLRADYVATLLSGLDKITKQQILVAAGYIEPVIDLVKGE